MRRYIVLLTLLLLLAGTAMAQTGTVSGVALDTLGNTVAGATVTVCPNGSSGIPCSPVTASTTSNGQGAFSVTVPIGTYTVTVFRSGVVATSSTVVVAPSNITVANNLTYSGNIIYTGSVTYSGSTIFSSLQTFNGGITSAGPNTFKNLNTKQFADQFAGATADVQITAAIAALPVGGGTVDATGFTGAQTISAQISIPANVKVILGPNTFTFSTGASSCVFKLTGNGAKLWGQPSAFVGNQGGTGSPGWTGTLLVGSSINATNVGICTSTPASGGTLENLEVKDIAVDMTGSNGTTAGGDCMQLTGVSNSLFQNVWLTHCGGNGLHVLTSSGTHSYSNDFDRIVVRFVGSGVNGFFLDTTPASGNDIDKFTFNNCTFWSYDLNSTSVRTGSVGFLVETGTALAQGIANLHLWDVNVHGSINGGFGAELLQQTSAQIQNVWMSGEIEDNFNANTGTAFEVVTTGASGAQNIHLFLNASNYATFHNLSTTTARDYVVYSNFVAPYMDQLFVSHAAPTSQLTGGTVGADFISAGAITNTAGWQVFNTTTTCTTGAAVGATCTTAAISLPVAAIDTSYRITCTGKGPTAVPVISTIANSSASQFTITIAALTAVAASFTSYDCIVGHN